MNADSALCIDVAKISPIFDESNIRESLGSGGGHMVMIPLL